MEYIVLLDDGEGGGGLVKDGNDFKIKTSSGKLGKRAKPKVELASFDKDSQVADVLRDPKTVSVARNMPLKLIAPFEASSTGRIASGDAWGIAAVRAEASPFTGKDVRVAVLDTGLMKNWTSHQAFKGQSITQSNFTDELPDDEDGHGTHCAGTIFGRDVEHRRIGIAQDSIPIIGKVLGRSGGTTGNLLKAIQWAAQQGADIISMSLGYDFPGMVNEGLAQGLPGNLAASMALEAYRANLRAMDALLQMLERSTDVNERSRPLVIAAAGNESALIKGRTVRIAPALPSASHGVLSVGALGRVDDGKLDIAVFSNGIPWITAPGVDIVSVNAANGGLRGLSGTSMACPHVTGVAALWWEWAARRHPGSRELADIVKEALRQNAKQDELVAPKEAGAGLVQAPIQ